MSHSYVVPFVYRNTLDSGGKNLTFAGKTIVTKVVVQSSFSVMSANPDGSNPLNAYSIQQNINAGTHWYQNSLIQNAQFGLCWHLECFRSTGTNLSGNPIWPTSGQYYRSTDMAGGSTSGNPFGTVIPGSIDLRQGGYTLLFYTSDNGTDTISQRLQILNTSTLAILYDSGWAVVTDTFQQPSAGGTSGTWYDQLTVAGLVIGGVGYGQKGTFNGASFLVNVDVGVPDLAWGGQYWSGGVPYEDPTPGVNCASAETGNLTFPVVNRDTNGIGPLWVNGNNASIYITETGTLSWTISGYTNDIGGVATFGFIPHGKDPSPPGAGFYVMQTVITDQTGVASGTITLTPGQRIGWFSPTKVADGVVIDCYAYNNAEGSPAGYSQPVVVNITDSVEFLGS